MTVYTVLLDRTKINFTSTVELLYISNYKDAAACSVLNVVSGSKVFSRILLKASTESTASFGTDPSRTPHNVVRQLDTFDTWCVKYREKSLDTYDKPRVELFAHKLLL